MTPEAQARERIDHKLQQAGWSVQDRHQLNLGVARGVAVREFPTDTGPADYLLFVNRQPVGVIEAKRDEEGHKLTAHETQTARYANATLKWRISTAPLRFLFESTAQVIYFTDGLDPVPRSREIFHFFTPDVLQAWLAQPDTLRHRLATLMPPLPAARLRDCQIEAVTQLEAALAANRPRSLVHMATGAGKTFTAITSVYRLLKFGSAKRVLFLVDTRNLGKQAHQEFMAYTPPDDGRTFTELYNVQRLAGPTIDPHAQVCISTIQRLYSVLSGQPIDDAADDVSLFELPQTQKQAKLVRYNNALPIDTFDFIVIDECHRSIYNLWKQVLDYFDAFLIGLTATPDKRTFGFFNRNRGFLGRSVVFPKDVLMNIVGPPLGQVAVVPSTFAEWNVNQAIAIFRAVDGVLPRFLCLALLSPEIQRWLKARSKTTAGQTNLTLEVCRNIPMPLPPLDEQIEIVQAAATMLEAAAAQHEAIEHSLRRAAAQRKNILQAAFAGQLVPQDPSDEPASVLLDRIRAERVGRAAVAKPRGRRAKAVA